MNVYEVLGFWVLLKGSVTEHMFVNVLGSMFYF